MKTPRLVSFKCVNQFLLSAMLFLLSPALVPLDAFYILVPITQYTTRLLTGSQVFIKLGSISYRSIVNISIATIFNIEHTKSNICLVHANRFFTLLQLTNKTKTQPGSHCKFFLGKPCCTSVFFYNLAIRGCTMPTDLNNDGYENLILGTATYQLG